MVKGYPIAILGGMGPGASGYLYKLLIDLAIEEFGARKNDDFPDIILYSVPVPDFISNDRNRSKALKMLAQKVKLVNRNNAGCVAIACNTAHVLLPDLQKVSKVPFVSMIDEVARQVFKDRRTRVGLIGTPSTIKYGLYQKTLKKYGVFTIVPVAQEIITLEQVIRNVLKGKTLKTDANRLEKIAKSLKSKGAEGIILGCTELPLVFPQKYSLPIYNCVEILAMALLRKYYGKPQV